MCRILRSAAAPCAPPLGFRDLYKTLLNKLCRPRHGIGVDLDSGNEACISPTVDLCCSATEFDLSPRSIRSVTTFLCGLLVAILRSGLYAWSCNDMKRFFLISPNQSYFAFCFPTLRRLYKPA